MPLLAGVLLGTFEFFGSAGFIAGVYIRTALFSAVIMNNPATLAVPIFSTLTELRSGLSTGGLAYETVRLFSDLIVSAFFCYATSIAYQTNMNIHDQGGYTPMDWITFSHPLQVVFMLCFVAV